MFPFYGVKCLSCKAVHNWVKKHGSSFTDDEEVETEELKWLRQQSKRFYAAGFSTLAKRWYKCIVTCPPIVG
jgi:arsenate reductase-like glutaredoxin family protein